MLVCFLMGFREISDEEWDIISPFFFLNKSRVGSLGADDRIVLNGILYVLINWI